LSSAAAAIRGASAAHHPDHSRLPTARISQSGLLLQLKQGVAAFAAHPLVSGMVTAQVQALMVRPHGTSASGSPQTFYSTEQTP
jgi:hypothetical protein